MDPIRHDRPGYREHLAYLMIEDPLGTIDDLSGEDATETTAPYSYDISAYLHAERTCDGIIWALAQVLDTEPHELPPLYSAVECDALEQLFRPHRDGCPQSAVSLTFTYATYTVTLTPDGCLTIRE